LIPTAANPVTARLRVSCYVSLPIDDSHPLLGDVNARVEAVKGYSFVCDKADHSFVCDKADPSPAMGCYASLPTRFKRGSDMCEPIIRMFAHKTPVRRGTVAQELPRGSNAGVFVAHCVASWCMWRWGPCRKRTRRVPTRGNATS